MVRAGHGRRVRRTTRASSSTRPARPRPMAMRRWRGPVTGADRELLLDRCRGRTIDLGCGPGRLVEGSGALDVPAPGHRRLARGGPAGPRARCARPPSRRLRAGSRRGTVGLRPARRRQHRHRWPPGTPARPASRQILRPAVAVVVEVDAAGTGVVHHRWRLRVGGRGHARCSTGRSSDSMRSSGIAARHRLRRRGRGHGRRPARRHPPAGCLSMRLPTVADIEKRIPRPDHFTSTGARAHDRARRLGSVGIAVRRVLPDRTLEPLAVHVAGLAADRAEPVLALPRHPGRCTCHRASRSSRCCWSSCGRSTRGSSSVRRRAQSGQLRSTCSNGRRSSCSWPRRSSSWSAARSTSSSGIRGTSASGPRTRRSPTSRSARILVHIAVKLPVIRDALSAPGRRRRVAPIRTGRADAPCCVGVTVASALALLLTVGQTVPLLRRVSVFGVRDGDGPQDLPVNRTARAAGAVEAATDPAFALELEARRARRARSPGTSSRRCHSVRIGCRSPASRDGAATPPGPASRSRDLLALVDARPGSAVNVRSMQTRGAFGRPSCPPTSPPTRARCWRSSSTASRWASTTATRAASSRPTARACSRRNGSRAWK